MNRGIKGKLAAVPGLGATVSADTSTSAVDLKDYNAFGFLIALAAFAFDASNKIAFKLFHSDDNVSFSECEAKDYEGGALKEATDPADGGKVHAVGYVGEKRYVKLTLDVTGTVSVATQVIGISTDPLYKPAI